MRKNSISIKEAWIHVIVWVCIASFPVFISTSVLQKFEPAMLIRAFFPPILFYTNYSILIPKLLLRKRMASYIIASIIFLVVFNLLVGQLANISPFDQFQAVNRVFEKAQIPNFQYVILTFISLAFFLLGGILRLIKDFYERDKAKKEVEVQRVETELEFLKAQLNPHFLFNSLNSIYSLVRNQAKEAPEAVITLSELMRYMLYEANQNKVVLEKEIEYIRNYVALQRLRLSDSENVKLQTKGNFSDKMIAPLLLITFIENAFKYGTDFKGRTKVDIRIEMKGEHLYFRICNLIGMKRVDEDSSGIGLKNVENRLDFLYPKAHALDIDDSNGEYIVDLHLTLD